MGSPQYPPHLWLRRFSIKRKGQLQV